MNQKMSSTSEELMVLLVVLGAAATLFLRIAVVACTWLYDISSRLVRTAAYLALVFAAFLLVPAAFTENPAHMACALVLFGFWLLYSGRGRPPPPRRRRVAYDLENAYYARS